MNDIRYSLGALGKSKPFTAIAMLTVVLCIGANSAMFSAVNAILLKPYPWPDSERLVFVFKSHPLVSATNPLAFVTVPAFLMLVAVLSCWPAARRAARVEPMSALREE